MNVVSNCSKKSKEFFKRVLRYIVVTLRYIVVTLRYIVISQIHHGICYSTKKNYQLQDFKDHLLKRKHPEKNNRLLLLKIISTYETRKQ